MSAALAWGLAARAAAGEIESGDQCLVETFPGGAFVAVVDALGHGKESARTAMAAIAALREHGDGDVGSIIAHCHTRIRSTRGATVGVAQFDWRRCTMSWLGVGSVTATLSRRKGSAAPALTSLLVRPGVVGDRLPVLRPLIFEFAGGDTVFLVTDGIRADFVEALPQSGGPQVIANRILWEYGRTNDDALALVLRCPDGG